jgi:hypothetical protein
MSERICIQHVKRSLNSRSYYHENTNAPPNQFHRGNGVKDEVGDTRGDDQRDE